MARSRELDAVRVSIYLFGLREVQYSRRQAS